MQNKILRPSRLKPSNEALGTVVAYLAREAPFSAYRSGRLVTAVKYQLSSRNHVCLLSDDVLLAYAGWLPITQVVGEQWMRDEATLAPVETEQADAVALTVVSVTSKEYLIPLIRACRKLNPGLRVFFKRETGAAGRTRKANVLNR